MQLHKVHNTFAKSSSALPFQPPSHLLRHCLPNLRPKLERSVMEPHFPQQLNVFAESKPKSATAGRTHLSALAFCKGIGDGQEGLPSKSKTRRQQEWAEKTLPLQGVLRSSDDERSAGESMIGDRQRRQEKRNRNQTSQHGKSLPDTKLARPCDDKKIWRQRGRHIRRGLHE